MKEGTSWTITNDLLGAKLHQKHSHLNGVKKLFMTEGGRWQTERRHRVPEQLLTWDKKKSPWGSRYFLPSWLPCRHPVV